MYVWPGASRFHVLPAPPPPPFFLPPARLTVFIFNLFVLVVRDYFLAYSWYGGGFHQGDYYSCAQIRIRGGPIQNSWKPIYVDHKNGKCDSAAGALGQCRKEPCYRSSRWIRPDEWNGRSPAPLNRWQVNK